MVALVMARPRFAGGSAAASAPRTPGTPTGRSGGTEVYRRLRSLKRARIVLAAAGVTTAVLVPASPALAHAVVVSADPSPATGLPQAPGAVVMRFSEPLNRRLSRIRVLGHPGRDIGVGPTRAVAGDVRAMERKLGALRPDLYTVVWTTVSSVDGHTLRGSYTFGVGVDATNHVVTHDNPVSSEGWLGLVGRLFALTGLALWAGVAIAGPVARRGGLDDRHLRRLARTAPGATLAGTAASALSASLVSSGSVSRVGDVLGASASGRWRLVLLAAAAVGFAWPSGRRVGYHVLAGVAVVAEAAGGHAAGTAVPAVAVVALSVHLGAVGLWGFAIVAASIAGLATGRQAVVRILAALSPWAVGAAAVVLATGIANAALELNGPAELASSGYGRAVAAKAGVFLAMAACGLVHHRRRRRPADTSSLANPLRAELIGAVVALMVATALVGFPNPPRQAEASERAAAGDPVLSRLAGSDALSVADASGPFVVGLTVLPPRPGPVELRVQVVGMEPGDGLRQAHVHGSGPQGTAVDADLVACGLGCFAGRAEVDAIGDWRFEASAASNRGPVVMAVTVPLPAPDGSPELHRALDALERLRSARLHEDLRGSVAGPLLASDYAFQAPDGFRFTIHGSDEIVLGNRTFRREAPDRAWTTTSSGYAFDWPGSYFGTFWGPGVAARIIGEENVDGVASKVVAFVRPDLPAWFRIWVGEADGLVRREEMRTEGHLMDHTWSAFDQPVDVRPPL